MRRERRRQGQKQATDSTVLYRHVYCLMIYKQFFCMTKNNENNYDPSLCSGDSPRNSYIHKRLFISDKILRDRITKLTTEENIVISGIPKKYNKPEDYSLDIFVFTEKYCNTYQTVFERLSNNTDAANCLVFFAGASVEDRLYSKVDTIIPQPVNMTFLLKSLKAGYRQLQQNFETEILQQQLRIKDAELLELAHIGQQLMMEKDYNTLLNLILQKSRELTYADAGSLYLVEKSEDNTKHLRFMLTHNDSVSFEFQEFTLPISRESISGYVADTGMMLNLPDVYDLPKGSEFSINKSFDKKIGYRTKSMLVIPLINHQDEVIGVIQLINKKLDPRKILKTPEDFENAVAPFHAGCVDTVSALAGHAAVSIENNYLYRSIERLFEGFVNASVTAIESRDPTTHGHSSRVATLTVNLAVNVDKTRRGPLKDIRFTRDQLKEIRYASLLHDFGKVGVREPVLLKAKKLYPYQLKEIRYRIALLRKVKEIEYLKNHIQHLLQTGNKGYMYSKYELNAELQNMLSELDRIESCIEEVNEPTVLQAGQAQELNEISKLKYSNLDGVEEPLLHTNEIMALSIGRGSLTAEERLEIESHVTHTFKFLSRVPWTSDLKNIPEIAYMHHEKLNGGGYPNGVRAEDIPVQSKMMTISDIFDALTAADRPYKKAVPFEKALDILKFEVKNAHIDMDLLSLFIEAKIYKSVS